MALVPLPSVINYTPVSSRLCGDGNSLVGKGSFASMITIDNDNNGHQSFTVPRISITHQIH